MSNSILALYRKLAGKPGGDWLFSRLICLKAPYFSSISPRVTELRPGLGKATLLHRRRVSNHIGTVHAIALCNLAEFIGGLTTEVSVPASMRWIPKGMQVEYLKKAVGTMRAVAIPDGELYASAEGYAMPVKVTVTDHSGDLVFRASIDMWISPRPRAGPGR